tara:strand:- start:4162 stop:5082 length:921 start_codon:yes stop_codon:yes gene_type:complete
MKSNFTILPYLCIGFCYIAIIVILYYLFDSNLLQKFSSLTKRIKALKQYLLSSFNWETFVNNVGLPESTLYNTLDQYNVELTTQKIKVITKHNSYGKGSFNDKIKQEVKPTINRVLNNINTIGEHRLKLLEIDRIEEIIDSEGNIQYLVQIFVHTVDTSASSKLVLNFYKSAKGIININSLQPESKTLKEIGNLKSVTNTPEENMYKQFQKIGVLDPIQEDIDFGAPLSKLPIYEQSSNSTLTKSVTEPCKYNLNSWDTRGINDQIKLYKKCSITNNSSQLPAYNIYKNPTMFSHAFVNPNSKYHN